MSDFGELTPSEADREARWLTNAIGAVQTPGTLLQWYGMVSAFFSVLALIVYLVSPETVFRPFYDWQVEQQKQQPAGERTPPLPPYNKWAEPFQLPSIASTVLSLAGSIVIVIGGLKMKLLTGYGWAVTGALLAAIPCTSSCCLVGLPVGLWALSVLFGADIRLAFKRVAEISAKEAASQ